MIKAAFFGTSEFAERILTALIADGRLEILEVVTQPDRRAERNKSEARQTPVKLMAARHGLPVAQPETLDDFSPRPGAVVNITAEYGKLIPRAIFSAPPFGTVNIHPSLLPKWRGASPLQSALAEGAATSGVSVMLIDDQLDHGPLLGQLPFAILPEEKFPALRDRVADLAANFLLRILPDYLEKKIPPAAQDDSAATYCGELKRADGQVDWTLPTAIIYNRFRAFTPWPGTYTFLKNKRIKLLEISPADSRLEPGKIIFSGHRILIGTGDGAIEVTSLQTENKLVLTARDFINGHQSCHNVQLA